MARAEVSTTIKRPIEEVFAVLSDSSNGPKWISGEVESKKTSDGSIGVGTTWHRVGKFLGRRIEVDSKYTEFEANRKLVITATSPFPFTSEFTLEPVAAGTRVNQVIEAEPGGFFKLVGPLLETVARRQFQNDLDNLRDLMEADAL